MVKIRHAARPPRFHEKWPGPQDRRKLTRLVLNSITSAIKTTLHKSRRLRLTNGDLDRVIHHTVPRQGSSGRAAGTCSGFVSRFGPSTPPPLPLCRRLTSDTTPSPNSNLQKIRVESRVVWGKSVRWTGRLLTYSTLTLREMIIELFCPEVEGLEDEWLRWDKLSKCFGGELSQMDRKRRCSDNLCVKGWSYLECWDFGVNVVVNLALMLSCYGVYTSCLWSNVEDNTLRIPFESNGSEEKTLLRPSWGLNIQECRDNFVWLSGMLKISYWEYWP